MHYSLGLSELPGAGGCDKSMAFTSPAEFFVPPFIMEGNLSICVLRLLLIPSIVSVWPNRRLMQDCVVEWCPFAKSIDSSACFEVFINLLINWLSKQICLDLIWNDVFQGVVHCREDSTPGSEGCSKVWFSTAFSTSYEILANAFWIAAWLHKRSPTEVQLQWNFLLALMLVYAPFVSLQFFYSPSWRHHASWRQHHI